MPTIDYSDKLLDEAHPLRPTNTYALSKVAGEEAAGYFVAQRDLEILSFRFMGIRVPSELDAQIPYVVQHPDRDARLLWTRCDARDAALACRLAVEAQDVEPGPYNITGRRVLLDVDSADLIARHFGSQTEVRERLEGHLSPLSCARAAEAFGYRPRYLWSVNQRHLEEA